MKSSWGLTIAAVALVGLSGCATPEDTGSIDPGAGGSVDVRGEWTFTGGSDADGPLAMSDFPVTMEFRGQNARVRTGCFSFDQPLSGELDVTTIALTSSPMASCLGLTEEETAAIQSLATITGAERAGDSLLLFSPSVEMTFELVPAVAVDDAVGDWALAGAVLFGDTAVMTEIAATLRIDADGTVTGFTGCADFTGAIDIVSGTNRLHNLSFVDTDCTEDDAVVATMVREVIEGGFLVHLIDGGLTDDGPAASQQLSLIATGADTTINFAPVA